jgi:hypothetical protein
MWCKKRTRRCHISSATFLSSCLPNSPNHRRKMCVPILMLSTFLRHCNGPVPTTLLSSLDSSQEDPVISTDITDNRQNFLGQCQMSHWQFSTLRHAQYASLAHPHRVKSAAQTWRALSWRSAQSQYRNPVFVFDLRYSTMMILNHIHNKPSYCIDTCQRGRVEDGSFMVSCSRSISRPFARCLTRPPSLPHAISSNRLAVISATVGTTVLVWASPRTRLISVRATCAPAVSVPPMGEADHLVSQVRLLSYARCCTKAKCMLVWTIM